MATILHWPKHVIHYDSSGLAMCDVCGGAEASMPTACPGRQLTNEEHEAVIADELDFTRREGWTSCGQERRRTVELYVKYGKDLPARNGGESG